MAESKVQKVARKTSGEKKPIAVHEGCGGEIQWVWYASTTGRSRMAKNCTKCGILQA